MSDAPLESQFAHQTSGRSLSPSTPGMTVVSEGRGRSPSGSQKFHISSSEYQSLASKASQYKHMEVQYENSQSLVKVLSDEVEVMRVSLSSLTSQSPNPNRTPLNNMEKHIQGIPEILMNRAAQSMEP